MYQITKEHSPADSTLVFNSVLPEQYETAEQALEAAKELVDNFQPIHPSYPVNRYTLADNKGYRASTKFGKWVEYLVVEK